MFVHYARTPLPFAKPGYTVPNSIFLAGPTPREKPLPWWRPKELEFFFKWILPPPERTPSWRPEALEYLRGMGFDGHVFVPEDEEWGLSNVIYEEQTRWEIEALARASAIVFWIPRQFPDMPALTTNTEFGFCVAFAADRVILGAPPEAKKVKYQKQLAKEIDMLYEAFTGITPEDEERFEIPVYDTLRDTLTHAMEMASR